MFGSFSLLHSKSNYFGTLELHVVKLIAIILHCDCPHRFDIVLFAIVLCFRSN